MCSPPMSTVCRVKTEPRTGDMSIPRIQQAVSVLWPSFVLAGFATIALFATFDPQAVGRCVGVDDVERLGAYTVGFFMLWLLTLCSSLLTVYFQRPTHVPVPRPYPDEPE